MLHHRGKRVRDYVAAEDVGKLAMAFIQAVKNADSVHMESAYHVHKNQGMPCLELSATPIIDEQGQVIGFRGVSRDISERKRAELAMQLSERRFRLIANYTYDWEMWLSFSGMPIWTNPAVARITGYTAEQCQAMHDYPLAIAYEPDRGNSLICWNRPG